MTSEKILKNERRLLDRVFDAIGPRIGMDDDDDWDEDEDEDDEDDPRQDGVM